MSTSIRRAAKPSQKRAPAAKVRPNQSARPTPSTSSGIDTFVVSRQRQAQKVVVPAPGAAAPQLIYGGGKVLTAPTPINLYLGAYWSTPAGKSDRAYNDAATADMVKSPLTSVWAQYAVGAGAFGGSAVLSAKAPKTVNKKTVEAMVQQALSSGQVPKNDNGIYTVVLPPGVVLDAGGGVTSEQGLGGYHGSYLDGATGKPVYYAAIAYSQGSNGINFDGKPRDNLTITESHEWTEAATDPDVNRSKLGWYDQKNGEIGDIAVGQSSNLPLSQAYATLDGYAIQKEWSNKDQALEVQAKNPGPVQPLPPAGSAGV